MDKLFAVTNFLKYRIFDLLNNVIRDQTPYYCFGPIEELRLKLLEDDRLVSVTDLGAGSSKSSSAKRVSDIAKNSLQEKKYSQLIFRLVNCKKHY